VRLPQGGVVGLDLVTSEGGFELVLLVEDGRGAGEGQVVFARDLGDGPTWRFALLCALATQGPGSSNRQ